MTNCLKCAFCERTEKTPHNQSTCLSKSIHYYCWEYGLQFIEEMGGVEFFSFMEGDCKSYCAAGLHEPPGVGEYSCYLCGQVPVAHSDSCCSECLGKISKLEELEKEVGQLRKVASSVKRGKAKFLNKRCPEIKPKLKLGQRKIQVKEE